MKDKRLFQIITLELDNGDIIRCVAPTSIFNKQLKVNGITIGKAIELPEYNHVDIFTSGLGLIQNKS